MYLTQELFKFTIISSDDKISIITAPDEETALEIYRDKFPEIVVKSLYW